MVESTASIIAVDIPLFKIECIVIANKNFNCFFFPINLLEKIFVVVDDEGGH